MSKVQLGSICVVGTDECQEESICLKMGTRDNGICRAMCRRNECPNGFKCIFTALDGDFQPLCMPIPESDRFPHRSEYRTREFGFEDALIAVFGIFLLFLLYHVLKACFGNTGKKEDKKRTKQHSDKSTFQSQGLYHTPGCPACAAQFVQYSNNGNNQQQQQPFAGPPPYNPQSFSPSNFRQA